MDRDKEQREIRAFEALIVSVLRNDVDPIQHPEALPRLTEQEKAALDALDDDLVHRLWSDL